MLVAMAVRGEEALSSLYSQLYGYVQPYSFIGRG